jgi:hypothetical protein
MGDIQMEKVFYDQRIPVETLERWQEIGQALPYIPVRGDWKIRVMPPFAGALARFHVMRGDAHVSVYYDEYCRLGGWDEGYWEIWPDADGNNYRLGRDDAEELADVIEASLVAQEKQPLVDAVMAKIKSLSKSDIQIVDRAIDGLEPPSDFLSQLCAQNSIVSAWMKPKPKQRTEVDLGNIDIIAKGYAAFQNGGEA